MNIADFLKEAEKCGFSITPTDGGHILRRPNCKDAFVYENNGFSVVSLDGGAIVSFTENW